MKNSDGLGRILLGAAAVVWLAVIGMSVAAIVALAGMGSGRAGEMSSESGTPWGLYIIIGISAVVIVAAVPLLLRARRTAVPETPVRPPAAAATGEAPTEKLRVFGTTAAPSAPPRREVDLSPVLLRFCAALATAMGAAALAVAVATYCMAEGADAGAWAALVVAGIITAAMPAIGWWQQRELSGLVVPVRA